MAWTYNGKIIREGRSWVGIDGVQHPVSWGRWSDEEKQAAGLTHVADPARYDNRFWWDANTPKALDDVAAVNENGDPVLDEKGQQIITLGLKSVWKNIVKQQAGGLLADTDWYVTRNAETGMAIPADVTTYRAAVRTASGTIEAAIDGAADHAAFVALFDTPVDADGNPTGNAPIADWPE
jgi:hypothetical protein